MSRVNNKIRTKHERTTKITSMTKRSINQINESIVVPVDLADLEEEMEI